MVSRRELGRLAMASIPTAAAVSLADLLHAKPNSKIQGVQIGAITYSFRADVKKPEIPALFAKLGISSVELMSGDAEAIAGIPTAPPAQGAARGAGRGGRGGGRGPQGEVAMAPNGCPANSPEGQHAIRQAAAAARGAGAAPAPARGGGGGGRGAQTPEQMELQSKIRDWRAAANDARWKAVRRQFNALGVDVHILCFNMNNNMTNEDFDYAFQMARGLGVRAISCSTTVTVAQRVAPFADKYKIMWGGHGHFTAAGYDPIQYIKDNHRRITNLHLKDRMKPDKCGNSANVPWGSGGTPIKEVLQLMKKEKYKFPANIEFEYPTPQGSNSETEVAKCFEHVKKCFES